MANLLERSSLVLTPTAYNNGEALCIKPDDGSGDFDFSRNSAATRVNAQGLVENVQILSSNLVQNGDFSEEGVEEVSNGSFSQEGVQLVTNGDFSNGLTDWVVDDGTSWTNVNNTAFCDGNNGLIKQGFTSVNNKTYKITFDVVNVGGGELGVRIGSGTYAWNNYPSGSYVKYLVSGSSTSEGVLFYATSGWTGSIDNVSVREVGQDWSLGGEVTIGNNLAHFESNTNTYSYIRQDISSLTTKTYKIQLEVKNYVSGAVQVGFSGSIVNLNVTTNGIYTAYTSPNTSGLLFEVSREFNGGNFNFDITNISVKEVGMDWQLGTDVVIGDSVVKMNNSAALQGAIQTNVITSGNLCKVSFEVKNYVNGIVNLRHPLSENVSANGVYTFVGNANDTKVFIRGADTTNNFEITNISVIEITTDTNLPRISYENFSYQDALGSELILNGDFSNGTNDWSFTSGATLTALGAKITHTPTAGSIAQLSVLTIGKQYKLTYEITESISGGLKFNSAVNSAMVTTVGVHTKYFEADGTTAVFGRTSATDNDVTITNISIKEYLGQEVVPDSGCGSWLWEPQSTNLVPYSEDFSQWSVIGTPTITSNYGISPDGTQNSTRIQFNNSDRIYESVSVSGDITYSVYLKGVGEVRLRDNAGIYTLDITLTDQWVRYEYSFNGTITNVQIQQSVGTSDLEIWGAQVEALSYPTSMIPTSGSTVTRNQDVCTNGGSLATINSTEGVLYAEIAALSNDGGNRRISLNDGSDNNRINLMFTSVSNQIVCNYKANGTTRVSLSTISYSVIDINKIAFKWKLGDFQLFVNGVKISTDNNTTMINANTLNTIDFRDGNALNPFFGKTKALAVWKEALSDAELTELTTI